MVPASDPWPVSVFLLGLLVIVGVAEFGIEIIPVLLIIAFAALALTPVKKVDNGSKKTNLGDNDG